ncbi:DsbA family oxidoreductase [Pseudomonas sp. GD03860]|uniref:DsbA family oxidoreductase n=1 Tax=Pseudomonas TaxID=286 RepID=UPI002363D457|nr:MULTISPECIES: DsbA family oxidoreductase [Pseudomonas]MDD2058211.1 DsbA family oxidoreductase [Pseudomonas putida]MDH0636145.1 DsbA family oxidoreductase [Pseudomonas sp. GD03860]
MKPVLSIDVFFDFICPWCLIGQRHLERALGQLRAEYPQLQVNLRWRGVQLLPNVPAEGLPFEAFYLQRLGSEQAVRHRQAQVKVAANAAGEPIDFSRISRMPNTADAHRLLERAVALGNPTQVQALLDQLFAGYFHQGKDLGNRSTLLSIAEGCGLMPAQVADCLRGDATPFIGASPAPASGVPCFSFNQHRVVSGAQPVEVLLEVIRESLEEATA